MSVRLLPVVFSALHLLTLALGLGSITIRARALLRDDRPTALAADGWWGLAAVLWLVTGLARAFGGLEKGSAYYLQSHAFWTKMALFGLVWALEAWPMITLIRWRIAGRRGQPQVGDARVLGWISAVEVALIVAIPFVAAAMARGF